MAAPERRSPLDGAPQPGYRGCPGPGGPGVTVTVHRGLSLVQITARRGRAAAAATRLGIDPTPGRASDIAPGPALWLAPGTWLVVAEGWEENELRRSIEARLDGGAALADQSHGRVVLRLAGPRAREVLAKGCRLDLHPRAFQPGQCAQTTIAHTAVLLHQLDDRPAYDLYVPSSYAIPFFEWLEASVTEFGARFE